jgi:hypothetical protein
VLLVQVPVPPVLVLAGSTAIYRTKRETEYRQVEVNCVLYQLLRSVPVQAQKPHLNSREVYSKYSQRRKLISLVRRHSNTNIFGVKIKWPVHPVLPIDLHRRYIFALKIHLCTKDTSSHQRYIFTPKIHLCTKDTSLHQRYVFAPKIHLHP